MCPQARVGTQYSQTLCPRSDSAGVRQPPKYAATLVDPFRDHLRRRRSEQPGVAVTRLLAEIRDLGYTGSANLLVRYLNQGRAEPERTPPHLAG